MAAALHKKAAIAGGPFSFNRFARKGERRHGRRTPYYFALADAVVPFTVPLMGTVTIGSMWSVV